METIQKQSARTVEHIENRRLDQNTPTEYCGDADLKLICHLSPPADAMLRVAIDIGQKSGHSFDRPSALNSLRRNSLDGPFHLTFVCRTALKLINRRGHGVNGSRFKGPELAAFRMRHSNLSCLSDAMVMFLVACRHWAQIKGSFGSSNPARPAITSDLHNILRGFGFQKREREALVRIITWRTKRWGE